VAQHGVEQSGVLGPHGAQGLVVDGQHDVPDAQAGRLRLGAGKDPCDADAAPVLEAQRALQLRAQNLCRDGQPGLARLGDARRRLRPAQPDDGDQPLPASLELHEGHGRRSSTSIARAVSATTAGRSGSGRPSSATRTSSAPAAASRRRRPARPNRRHPDAARLRAAQLGGHRAVTRCTVTPQARSSRSSPRAASRSSVVTRRVVRRPPRSMPSATSVPIGVPNMT